MKVLAIEFSSHQRSVGLAITTSSERPVLVAEAVETGGRAANTFRMVNAVLGQAGLEREEIECIAIGIGPGSYTGIRAAISAAQGWQLATGVRLLGVASSDCIAAEAGELGLGGRVAVVIDAQRGEYYVAEYLSDKAGRTFAQTVPLRIVSLQQILDLENSGVLLIGPQAPVGAKNFRVVMPRGSVLARMAVNRIDFLRGEDMAPIYLRETTFVKAKV